METVLRKIDKLGRVVLPMDFRKALGLEGEVEVVLSIRDNFITIRGAGTHCRLCGSSDNVEESLGVCLNCIKRIRENTP